VAAIAGVHSGTVSRVLTRPELVGAETLQRVQDAIETLQYVPNRAARQLAGGSTSTIAVLVPDIANPFFSIIVQAARRHAGTVGSLVLLGEADLDPTTELDAVDHLARHVDGLIVCSPTSPTTALAHAARGRPMVLVNRRARGIPSVAANQGAIVALAIDHLVSLQHDRIAVVSGPARYWSSLRRDRIVERQAARGPEKLIRITPAIPTFAGGSALLSRIRESGVTAVLAFNDIQALGILAAASAAGHAVPDDLSVVGVDGLPTGAMASPLLTSVGVDLEAMGQTAADLLLARIAGGTPADVEIDPVLLTRGSTAGPGRQRQEKSAP
jgi:LacI family transcriptional regulator